VQRHWANKRLDASFADWWAGLRATLVPTRPGVVEAVERRWGPDGSLMVGLSVRSLFDLWLSAQGWGTGDRIVCSAYTVADMAAIARAHGLEVVALDIDPLSGVADPDRLRDLLDRRTRAVVHTHLFGARTDVAALLAVTHERGACFVEDAAEAYAGPGRWGHPGSDLALYSFGPIKTATALGGAVARVADPAVATGMRRLAATWPQQPRRRYLQRLAQFGLLHLASTPVVFGGLVRLLDRFGPGHDVVLHRLTRGFPGPDLLVRIRHRPTDGLVWLLDRRLAQGDAPLRRRDAPARRLLAGLDGLAVPTGGVAEHGHWLVPVLAPDPDALVARLGRAGFHATRGRSFAVVEHDPGVDAPDPVGARTLHEHAVFLPFDPAMAGPVLDELARVVRAELGRQAGRPG